MAYGNQTLGRGEVWFSRFKPGTQTPEGLRYLGNTPEFGLTIDTSFLDHFSSDRGIREKDKSIPLETTRSGSLTCDDIQLDNLAYFFFGSKAILAQTSATAVTETFNAIAGRMYQIGQTNSTPVGVRQVTVASVAKGATTFAAIDDYIVDAARGTILFVEGGAIKTGDDVVVTYGRAAVSRNQVISGSTAVDGALLFVSYNPEGERNDFRMPYVKLSPNGDFNLKGDDWQTIPFTIEILRATNREAIYIDGQPYVVTP
jgi:hypothetical protein